MNEPLSPSAQEALKREVPAIDAALARILECLDLNATECPSCNLTKRHNFRDHQLAEFLRSTSNKLKNWTRTSRRVGG